ncbi:MAG: alpha/beta hydrolase family protein, partial [Dehalococcoidia bacterium]
QYADHEVRRAEIPFQGKAIPGWLHLPRDPVGGRLPCVISIPGMDSFKEGRVAQYGDKMLERGIAVLAIDGPGQSEALLRGVHVDATNWLDTGREVVKWIGSQPDLDPKRIGVTGTSFGSFWGTQVASVDDGIKGCAVQGVAHEPARYTLFHMEAPTFKLRFMFMSGYEDEEEFDQFVESITLDGIGESIKCPYLAIAGEDDSHSPIEYTYRLLDTIRAPKEMLLYEGADHGIGGSSSAELGPNPANYLANWLKDRLDGKPMESRHVFVDLAGQTHGTSFDEAGRHNVVAASVG